MPLRCRQGVGHQTSTDDAEREQLVDEMQDGRLARPPSRAVPAEGFTTILDSSTARHNTKRSGA